MPGGSFGGNRQDAVDMCWSHLLEFGYDSRLVPHLQICLSRAEPVEDTSDSGIPGVASEQRITIDVGT